MANVKKNKTAGVGKFSYSYTDLAAINDFLDEQNLAYDQYIETEQVGEKLLDRIMTQRYRVKSDGVLEEWGKPMKGLRLLYGANETPQQLGSKVTYLRRYSLLMAFGLAAEDDDGAGGKEWTNKKPSQEPKQPPQKESQPKQETPRQGNQPQTDQVDKKLVFSVKGKLVGIKTDAELDAYWRELHLSPANKAALQPEFAKQREAIRNGVAG